MRKNISIKVYTQTNIFLKEWKNFSFGGFTKEINAGLGECIIELFEKFDYTGGELALGNTVTITIADKDTTATKDYGGRVIYSGYISLYEPRIDGARESITVHLLGHYTKLATDILKSTAQTTLYTKATVGLTTVVADIAAADAGDVIKGIFTRYAAETSSPKTVAMSVPTVGQNIKYVFNQKTYRDALDIALKACPSGYFYYIDECGGFYLKQPATTPKHTFILNKNITNVQVERSMEKIRNTVLIWNGLGGGSEIYKAYTDTVSVTTYGRRVENFQDKSVQDETSMANMANKFINEHKDPDIKVTCKIIDNNLDQSGGLGYGYDIESIEPGDTCRFTGFNESFANIFKDAMLITKVEYKLDSVILTIENFKTDLVDTTKQTQDNLDVLATDGIPESYT